LDMPGKSTNIINGDFVKELEKHIAEIAKDQSLKGLIVTSAKKDFLAGGDLAMFYNAQKPEDCMPAIRSLNESFTKLEKLGKPVVAAINGTALGGGLEFTLACHYRICVNDPK